MAENSIALRDVTRKALQDALDAFEWPVWPALIPVYTKARQSAPADDTADALVYSILANCQIPHPLYVGWDMSADKEKAAMVVLAAPAGPEPASDPAPIEPHERPKRGSLIDDWTRRR